MVTINEFVWTEASGYLWKSSKPIHCRDDK